MRKTAIILLLALVLGASALAPGAASQTPPQLAVSYKVTLGQHFSVLSTISQRVSFGVSVTTPPHTQQAVLKAAFTFTFLAVNGLPQGSNYTVALLSDRPPVTEVTITVPASYDQFNFTIAGRFTDFSVLYRNSATIPRVFVSMNIQPFTPTSYYVLVPDDPGLEVVSIFPNAGTAGVLNRANATVISEKIAVGGIQYLLIQFPANFGSLVVLYQTTARDYYIYGYLVALVALVIGLPLLWRRVSPRLDKAVPKILPLVWQIMTWFNARKLLALFSISCFLMVTLAVAFGPPPVPRVYLSATPATAAVLAPTIVSSGYQYLTPDQAVDQLDTMGQLGNYNAIIVADFTISANDLALYSSNHIYLLTNYLPQTYVTQITQLFGNHTVVQLSGQQALSTYLTNQRVYITTNRLGLPVGLGLYNSVLLIEGVLTLVITFAALAFLARSFVEGGAKGWTYLAEAAALSFLVFMLTTMVFIQTSVLLGLPVALHAAISPLESALGLLGFGGGSRPRELAGVLGFVFGAISGFGGRMKVDRIGALAFVALVFFLATDPLTLGRTFYGIVLNLTTNESGGSAGLVAQETVRVVLGNVMDFFGRFITPFFYSSHGAVLFYVGAIPFAVFPRLRKTTATFLLLFSAAAASVGFIRVADLNAIEALDSATPGITLGLLFLLLFLAIGLGESSLRKLLG
ncbi:MAG: hypothetical protein OK452_06425 [Thaumarchaeota archaeon]|nr:hypothetical protein [Nitrososphaerota archaeon]